MQTPNSVTIRIGNRRYRAVPASQAASGGALEPAIAWATLRRALAHPNDLPDLLTLLHAISGTRTTNLSNGQMRMIEKAFVTGEWQLSVVSSLGGVRMNSGTDDRESSAEQVQKAREVKTWIEMEVVDENGRPMAGQPYVCMLPDGRIAEGSTDSRGRVRFDGIEPGRCVFSLTGLDQASWSHSG